MMLSHSRMVGFSFGITSGTVTTLGMMVGLYSSTESQLAVLGGIFAIAVADAFSDALGIHVSEEAEGKHSRREVWESTLSTFLTKFIFALTFAVPVLLLPLEAAVLAGVVWGMFALAAFSCYVAKKEGNRMLPTVLEHLGIAVAVVVVTYFVGKWVAGL